MARSLAARLARAKKLLAKREAKEKKKKAIEAMRNELAKINQKLRGY